jgi:hypothetical protein
MSRRDRAPHRPRCAAVPVNDPLHNRQADAGAFKFVRAVEALKDAEQFVRIPHVKTGPVVAHEIDVLVLLKFAADFNDGRPRVGGCI